MGKLGPTDSPTEGQARVGVQVAGQSCSLQGLLYLPSVFLLLGPHRDDRHLKRGQPQWPFSSTAFCKNSQQSFHRTEHCSVNEDWTLQVACLPLILEVKSQGQLEVKLDCPTLMGSTQGVSKVHINLRPIEGAISRAEVPGFSECLQGLLEELLSLVPKARLPQEARWSSGQCQVEGEAQDSIDRTEKIKTAVDLCLQLIWCTEDVSIVLLEAPQPRQSPQTARGLSPVQGPEVCQSQGQLLQDLGRWANIRQCAGQFMGLRASVSGGRLVGWSLWEQAELSESEGCKANISSL